MAQCDTDWGDLELELHQASGTQPAKPQTRITDIKVLVMGKAPATCTGLRPAYWETELAADAKPSTTLLYHGIHMKVLARSRDGQYVACATLHNKEKDAKQMLVLQKCNKKQQQVPSPPTAHDEWILVREVRLRSDFEDSSIIITDAEQQITVQARVEEDDDAEDNDHMLSCFSPNTTYNLKGSLASTKMRPPMHQKLIDVSIPPATVMMMPNEGSVSCMTIHDQEPLHAAVDEDENTDVVLDGVEAQAVACFIKQRTQERRQELSDAFRRFKTPASEASDFTLAYLPFAPSPSTGTTTSFPSLLSSSRKIGRPTYSADKGPRQCKSPPLTLQEELQVTEALVAAAALFFFGVY